MAHRVRGLTRRQVLLASAGGLAALLVSPLACARRPPGPCPATPRQTEGPFYPIEDQLDEDNDLTFVGGRDGRAEGQVIYVVGRVQDVACRPVPGVLVEIWQASARGRYNHPGDRDNPVPRDPHFQGWGESRADGEGRYRFKTIYPGSYAAGPGWIRPSHIHFKVRRGEVDVLTTQLYFAGDRHLEADRIFGGVPGSERERVIAAEEAPGRAFPPDARVYRFDLTLV